VPLVEIVTKPVFTDVKDAVEFCKKIQKTVRFLGIGDVDMEKGQMRLEANISLRTPEMEEKGDFHAYKVEVKNINSFRFMEKAVLAELERQSEVFASGEMPVQENRGFDEDSGKTVPQREKEEAHDYRYFPEPDIPPMVFSVEYIEDLKKCIPELPEEIKDRLVRNFDIREMDAAVLVDNLGMDFVKKFEGYVARGLDAQKTISALINRPETHLMNDVEFEKYVSGDTEGVEESELKGIIQKVINENPRAVEDFKKGKETSVQFLFGQVMRETAGKANPKVTIPLIKEFLK
jgi:aspartyl-tRNA(Asn)/glutamyl-tRNA(Gln) amidotransferase subunit B